MAWARVVTVGTKIGDVWKTSHQNVMTTGGQIGRKNASSMSPAFRVRKQADNGLSLRYRSIRHRRKQAVLKKITQCTTLNLPKIRTFSNTFTEE